MTKYDIYLIWGKDCDGNILRYYGSTANFIKRKSQHKIHYEYWVKQGRPNIKRRSPDLILDNGDWRMDKIDEIDGERWEARKLEGEYIKNNDCINVRIENRTRKERYEDNRDVILEKVKQYYANNKDKKLEYHKHYYNKNKETIADKQKIYNNKNKDKLVEYKKKYRADNKKTLLEKGKEKITCECGSKIRRSDISSHRKTKKHINLLSNNELNV